MISRDRPARILSVAVTGHRPDRLGGCDLAQLDATVIDVLKQISRAATTFAPTRTRLVSALAEGADSILADEAVKLGWSLDVILPFDRHEYARDFIDPDALEGYFRRLDHAHSVFELPGDRVREGGETAAYERAGRAALAQADLLLAVWDGHPVRGRGGAAQIVHEGVLKGIPVVRIDPTGGSEPMLLWDGLNEVDLGQQTTDSVARGGLEHLDRVISDLLDPPADADESRMLGLFEEERRHWPATGVAYPVFLALMGVRKLRWADFGVKPKASGQEPLLSACAASPDFAARLDRFVTSRFVRADFAASRSAALFRSGFLLNFSLSSLAVLLTMLSLALPVGAKLYLLTLEFATISSILIITSAGNRAGWHRQWLDSRALAERLRCLALTTQLGDLDLRNAAGKSSPWVSWYIQAAARELGLPGVKVDATYLGCVKQELLEMIDGQIGYLEVDARRMHQLDHRLHRGGSALFATTALACLLMLGVKTMPWLEWVAGASPLPLALVVTILGAALPSIGAAIYGIRMQGDFAGVAARSETLRRDLIILKDVIIDDELEYDALLRRIRRVADLMAVDLTAWLQTYTARPLTLPG